MGDMLKILASTILLEKSLNIDSQEMKRIEFRRRFVLLFARCKDVYKDKHKGISMSEKAYCKRFYLKHKK